jgi:uncharacterized protein YggE
MKMTSLAKKMFLAFLVVAMCVFTSTAFANERESNEGITVTGSASMTVAPDKATISMGVEKTGASAIKARNAATDSVNRMIRQLRVLGVSDKDIKTSDYYVRANYITVNKKSRISDYTFRYTVNVEVENINDIGKIIDAMYEAGANSMNSVQFGLKNRELLEMQLLSKAVKNAKAKARIVANAGGRVLGVLQNATINDLGGATYENRNAVAMYMAKSADATPLQGSTEIMSGDLTVKVRVYAKFALN